LPIWLPIVILAMIFNSWLQMKNVILILIFKFQDFSMVYWRFDLNHVYYLHFCFKDFKFSWEYNSQSDFTWECLWLTSLHSPTCGSVWISRHSPNPHLFSCSNFCCEFKINVVTNLGGLFVIIVVLSHLVWQFLSICSNLFYYMVNTIL